MTGRHSGTHFLLSYIHFFINDSTLYLHNAQIVVNPTYYPRSRIIPRGTMNNGVYIWNLQIYTNLHVLSRLKIARDLLCL